MHMFCSECCVQFGTDVLGTRASRLRTCTNKSLHDTILSGMKTCKPTRFSDLSLLWGKGNYATPSSSKLFPRHRICSKTSCLRTCTKNLHDTILSGMDTCKSYRFSDLSLIQCKSNCVVPNRSNNFSRRNMGSTARPCHFLHYNLQDSNKGSPAPLPFCNCRSYGPQPFPEKSSPMMRSGKNPLGLPGFNLSETVGDTPTLREDRGRRTNLAQNN